MTLARAVADLPLVTAGSGVAIGCREISPTRACCRRPDRPRHCPPRAGIAPCVGKLLRGNECAGAHFLRAGGLACALDPLALAAGRPRWSACSAGAAPPAAGAVLVYSTGGPAAVKTVQERLAWRLRALVESALARSRAAWSTRGWGN